MKKQMQDGSSSVTSASSSKAPSQASLRSSKSKSSTRSIPAPLVVEGFKMEVWAEDFQEQLQDELGDNTTSTLVGKRNIPDSFRGDQAMAALLSVLKQYHEGEEVTKVFCIQVGRAFMDNFGFFVNAVNPAKKFDGANPKAIYVFDQNLPVQVHKARKSCFPTTSDRVHVLEHECKVQDRSSLTKVYVNAFLASDAVAVVMRNKLAVSRADAVKFLNALNAKTNFCQSVLPHKPEFKDKKDLVFQFTPDCRRTNMG